MRVLTAAEMREVDRLTIELGLPGLILMENAGHRVVEFLAAQFAPLRSQRIVVLCGKGNNGGDGLVIARQLFTRIHPRSLHVVLAADPADLRGDAGINWRALQACGCPVSREITPAMRNATLVLDALLGTGLRGAPEGRFAEWIEEINTGFPDAKIVAVDIPSGMSSDTASSPGPTVRADYTVTFTAPKAGQVLPPNCDRVGQLIVAEIGSPASLYASARLHLVEPAGFAPLLAPRKPSGHKGDYGHVLAWAGSRGKTGAAAMAGIAALRAGAGLVTVGSAAAAIDAISAHAAELMTVPVDDWAALESAAQGKDVVAMGPGLGTEPATAEMVRRAFSGMNVPMVVDADALNCLASGDFPGHPGALRVLTPHPGEMSRLAKRSTQEVQQDRVAVAREFATRHQLALVLKGQRTVIAMPSGDVWINPTGSPAMGTGGSGDILTGLLAGLMAQFPESHGAAILAAVYLHGRSGELAAAKLGEKSVIAGDLLDFFPAAIREAAASN